MLRSRLGRQAQIRKAVVDQQLTDAASAGLQLQEDDDRGVPAPVEAIDETSQISSIFRRKFNRPPFDIDDPTKSVSRHLLLPVQKSGLVTWLYRDEGKVSCAMVVQLGAFFNVRLDTADVEAVLGSEGARVSRTGGFSEKSKKNADLRDSDSEPDPDEPAATKEETIGSSSGFSYEQFYGLVWQLKRELHSLYRDVMKRENDLKIEQDSAIYRLDVPTYTQQKGIADSLADFNRMSRVRLFGNRNTDFGGGSVSQPSVILSYPTMSVTSDSRTDDERDSISAGSHSTMIGSESGQSNGRTSSLATAISTVYHPQKNPDVFRHFYPSVVSRETQKLPIFAQFEKIMSMLATRRVSVISGRTGTGKTTQVPLMVLDQCANDKRPCNLIVTQPRRLAAIGVARRVCAERQWTVGQLVGYHVGLDKRTSQSTRLTYCTTGVFLEKIVAEKHLNNYTHVFLDEVHERDQDTDMALMLVRQMLRENSPDVKVILMSATVEVNKMTRYFGHNMDSFAMEDQLGRITIETASHEIYEKFLDEFAEQSDIFDFDINQPRLSNDLLALAACTLDNLEPVSHGNPPNQAVLVFLPGLEHISELANMIKARCSEAEVMVLHSTVSGSEQERVLDPPAPGVRRIILSTNIAESSLTIPYIDYVFDFCLTKVMRLNPRTKVPQLSLEWASVANCQQRKGRVGRVRKGRVYFFVPRKFFAEMMPRHPEPEVLIAPIEHSVLRVKMLKVAPPPAEVLVLLPDPPKRNDVEVALLTLKELGALTVKSHGQPSYADGDLTAMGQLLARFPMDVRVAKFLVLCCIFGYVQEGVTIASGLTIDCVICTQNLRSADRCKKLHDLYSSRDVKSDALALLYAFEGWNAECSRATFKSRLDEQRWCESHLIDLSRMKEFVALRREVWHRLNQRGNFLDLPSSQSVPREIMIPLLLAGAFYPSILINRNTINDVVVGKELLGYNPLHTCVIPKFGYATACQAPLYDDQLKNILKLNFDADSVARIIYGSRETYICFSRHSGNIARSSDSATNLHLGVELLKKRLEVMGRTIPLRQQTNSEDLRASAASLDVINSDLDTRFCLRENSIRLPPPKVDLEPGKRFSVLVADIENVELFWLAQWDEDNQRRQLDMNTTTTKLAGQNALQSVRGEDIVLFNSYLSCHRDSEVDFARVTVIRPPDGDGNVQVLLVDCGIIDRIPIKWLYVLPACTRTVPRACFEFTFSGLRFVASKKAAATEYIEHCVAVDESKLSLEVHSVIDGVVHGVIFWKSHFVNDEAINLNEEMIKLGYAYPGSESWISEYDHRRRLNGPVVPLPSSYDVPQRDVLPTEHSPSDLVHVGPVQFPARVNMQTIGRQRASAFVEPGSLNAFNYDRNPEDNCWPYRPLVACRLVHSGNRDSLKGHSTTVLPIQPGLLGILAVAFGPYVEIIMAEGEYIGALTGLGPFPGKSHTFYPDCEVELPFDAEMKSGDFTKLNQLRSKMNTVLQRITGEASDQSVTHTFQNSCVQILMDLVDKPRRVKPLRGSSSIYKWTRTEHNLTDDAAAMTFLVAVEFSPLPEELSEDSYSNIIALHHTVKGLMEKKSSPEAEFIESRCLLCNSQLGDPDLLTAHLFGEEHQAKERLLLGMKAKSSFRN